MISNKTNITATLNIEQWGCVQTETSFFFNADVFFCIDDDSEVMSAIDNVDIKRMICRVTSFYNDGTIMAATPWTEIKSGGFSPEFIEEMNEAIGDAIYMRDTQSVISEMPLVADQTIAIYND